MVAQLVYLLQFPQGQATLTTNDIVINKLAQILSYLRSGSKAMKRHKKAKEAAAKASGAKPEDKVFQCYKKLDREKKKPVAV
jgi:hypothetical protein